MTISTLLVDDQDDMRLLMRMVVEAANQELTVAGAAADGVEAIESADLLDPSVIVLDQRMPGLSGVETAREIRSRRPHQRFVLCSAHLDEEVRRLAAEVGIERCISKDELMDLPAVLRAVGGPCQT